MKNKYLPFIFTFFILLYSCSKSNDETAKVIPIAPSDLSANIISKGQIDLAWKDNSTNETGYRIERKSESGVFSEIGSTTKDVTIYSDKNVAINTKYTYRVYGYNEVGKSNQYSNEVIVKILDIASLSTSPITEITSNGAKSGGIVNSDGGSPITGRGVVWSTTSNPTVALTTKTNDGTGSGTFQSSIIGLTRGLTVNVRAYATNSIGTAYGNQITFQTLDIPTLTTSALTEVTTSSAKLGGIISSDGGSSITRRGVVWSTTSNPTVALTTKTNDGTGSGTFQSSISGLAIDTKYFVRAYATNSEGTAYGNELMFSTPAPTFQFVINTVKSKTGRIWLDRNLGASQVATSETDEKAYGDLYQWGRGSDGHQLRSSITTTVQSTTDNPGHGMFIISTPSPYYWRIPMNFNLWQGVNGINNPCPLGFRIPTDLEWYEEIGTWDTSNPNSAFLSPLKLTWAGGRAMDGKISSTGTNGYYWSDSRVFNSSYRYLVLNKGNWHMSETLTVYGYCVRCIKD
jgi:hypothetical protein